MASHRILFRSTLETEPWAGSEELWSQAAVLLAQEGHQVFASVKLWNTVHHRIQNLMDKGIKVYQRRYLNKIIAKIREKLLKFRDIDWLFNFQERYLVLSMNLVVVSQAWIPEGLDYLEWLIKCRKKYVIITQVNADFFWPDDPMAERMYKIFSGAEKVYFVAKANYELFVKQVGYTLENVRILYNPWHPSTSLGIVPWPKAQSLKLACVARLYTPAKGHELILEALAQPQWKDRDIHVSFVGAGEYLNTLKRFAAHLNVLEKVSFVGFANDISLVWKEHHALILASRWEGSPLALIEAMRCGRPAVCTAIGGMPELVEDNLTGFVAAAPRVSFVSEALERLWQNRDRLESMGQLAARRIAELIPEHPAVTLARELAEIASQSII